MTALTGQSLLNRYFLRQHVGAGGMADVYLAWDNVRSAKLAIKVLRRELIHNPRFFQMFAKEAELLRKLEHPNIVRLYEFERQGDIAFIVMDWVEGSNLKQAIEDRKRSFSFEEISHILQPVCSALHYAHQHNVFHCDVKPANILLHDDGRVLLTDFGVARLAAEGAGGGTPAFMAPEQFAGGSVDGRTDVYALGITIYEMLTGGELPFRGDSSHTPGTTSRERIGWEHLNQSVPSPRVYNTKLSSAIEGFVLTALHKQPSERFSDPMSLREAFEYARTQTGTSARAGDTADRKTILERPGRIEPRVPTSAVDVQGANLLCRRGELAGKCIPISQSSITIGRHRSNQIRFAERSVSRLHATLLVTRRGIFIRDENSSLGTFVNERKISGPTRLRSGDIIRIGYQQEFEFRET